MQRPEQIQPPMDRTMPIQTARTQPPIYVKLELTNYTRQWYNRAKRRCGIQILQQYWFDRSLYRYQPIAVNYNETTQLLW